MADYLFIIAESMKKKIDGILSNTLSGTEKNITKDIHTAIDEELGLVDPEPEVADEQESED